MKAIARNPKLHCASVPDGLYEGSWSGYVAIFKVNEHIFEVDTDKGVRGTTRVAVTVVNGIIVVEEIGE